MPTFGQLRKAVLQKASVKDHYEFMRTSDEHFVFWNEMNEVEFRRGYVRGVYERSGSPALCDLELLTETEYADWLKKFEAIKHRRN